MPAGSKHFFNIPVTMFIIEPAHMLLYFSYKPQANSHMSLPAHTHSMLVDYCSGEQAKSSPLVSLDTAFTDNSCI